MSAADDLTADSWRVFSDLLDQALELPVGERLTWLDGLSAEHEALKPALRAVLARSAGFETAQWLNTLPRAADAATTETSGLEPGTLVGPYRLVREIGTGGMGAVWLAERADGTLKRQVALKLPRASWSRGLAERMARERDILAALEHPNIARLYDAGTDLQGRPFLALEYVEGQPLDVYCRERALSVRQRLGLLLQVARAVAFAHGRLVVHRDLKPSNILVTADGQVRLLDFGIAKLMEGDRALETQLTQMAGRALTPDYASPEQIRGEPIGTASDVYSLGVVAYEVLAGARPYKLKRGSTAELEEAIASVEPPLAGSAAPDAAVRRELRGDLDAILNKALKKDPAARYASVDALAADLDRWLCGEPVHAQPDRRSYRVRKFIVRNRVAVGATCAVVLALLAGTGIALWQARLATHERDRALRLVERQEGVNTFLNMLITDAARGGQAFTAEQLLRRSEALIGPELESDVEVHAAVLSMISASMQTLGNSAEAIRLSERALGLVGAKGDPDLRDQIEMVHALAVGWSGRYADAKSALEGVLSRRDLAPERGTEAHFYLGVLASANNDAEGALRHAQAALQSLRAQRRPLRRLESSILASLGGAYSLHGRMAEADEHFAAAYALQQALGAGASVHAVTLLNNWAVINERAGDVRRAQELAERALALAGPEGRSPFLLVNRARALEYQGKLEEAEAGYREAAQIAAQRRIVPAQVAAELGMASIQVQRGALDPARASLARAGEIGATLPPSHPQRIGQRVIAGQLALAARDFASAQTAFESVIQAAPQQGSAVLARLGLAEVALARGDPSKAAELAGAAQELALHLQGGKPHSFRTGLAGEMRARALAAAGQIDPARRDAAAALTHLAATVDPGHPAVALATRLAQVQ